MKKKSLLLVLCALLILSVTVNAFEFIGGAYYTIFNSEDIDDMNDLIKQFNLDLETIEKIAEENDIPIDITKFKELKGSFGFYAGGLLPVTEKFKIGGYYERFNLKTEGGYHLPIVNAGEKYKLQIPVNGVVGTVKINLTDYLAINGAIGYYFGEMTAEVRVYEFGSDLINQRSKEELNGIGYKFGADINYPVNENINIFGGADYRILSVGLKDEDVPKEDKLNLDGYVIRGGISYSF